ncbi:Poly(A)-specific ribonuclease PARN-like [Rhynchospora pubera]|uniref:Poly(A)-specific ribonuclease PARN-like n=1 Tax=Rhynchospora pubera TaxID=906938 RepID=A0AAV8G3K1_9POAL|nr:Poly(A)-specific ribonuclease PARN-like [Rhynchospora pubera]
MSSHTVIKQVTKSTFTPSLLRELKSHIDACDFISLSSIKTFSATSASSWRRRLLPFDTAETAYLKAKLAAESFQILNVSICPFRVDESKVVAFPYNFHLFPREEQSYSFSCQASYLESLARKGFDFNLCIYEGISYLSRVQESLAKRRNASHLDFKVFSKSRKSVADSLFMERIKARIQYWRKSCLNSNKSPHGDLANSLRQLILGTQLHGERPCMTIDVCSDNQLNLILETVNGISDSLVPLVVRNSLGTPTSVRVVFTSSEEDKSALLSDIDHAEEEQNFNLRGFREVMDLISNSQKPIVSINCLNDFAFFHEKFIAPLPPSLHEFTCSLKMVFPKILDLGHLMKEIGPLKNAMDTSSSLNLEVPFQADRDGGQSNQGRNALKIISLFVKINYLHICNNIEGYFNMFHPTACMELESVGCQDDTNTYLTHQEDIAKLGVHNLVFLWGFNAASSLQLKDKLRKYHPIFHENFDLKVIDRNCAAIAFQRQGAVVKLLKEIKPRSSSIENMISDGVIIAGFGAYEKVCRMGLWDGRLADSLQTVVLSDNTNSPLLAEKSTEICWDNEVMLDQNEYLKV